MCIIVTGIGSILQDNSALTVRDVQTTRQPLRVIVDSELRIPVDAKVLEDGHAMIAYAQGEASKLDVLQVMGIRTLHIPNAQGQVDIPALMQALTALPCNEILIEAGATLNGAFLQNGLVDELLLYYAPKLMGSSARGMFALPELTQMSDALSLHILDIRQFGQDIRVQVKLQP
jgi:diaminohydroxyphosphoribosylaminopyrimidine deaminase/5-amino-6-(5-phosphoribosylamino)uracil reductase